MTVEEAPLQSPPVPLTLSRQLNIYGHSATSACSQISPSSQLQTARQKDCLKLNSAEKQTVF